MDPNNQPQQPGSQPQQTPPPAPQPAPPEQAQAPVIQATPAASPTPPVVAPAQAGASPAPNPLPSAWSLFGPSWEALKFNFLTAFILALIPTIFYIIGLVQTFSSSSANTSFQTASNGLSYSASSHSISPIIFIGPVLWLFIWPSLVYIQVKSAQKVKVGAGEALRKGVRRIISMFFLMLLMVLGVTFGLVLLIVPGFLVLKRVVFAPYVMMAEEVGISESLKRSSEMSKVKGSVWGLLGVDFLLGLIGIIPVLGWVVNFVGSIIYSFAFPVRYWQIKALTGGAPAPPTNPVPTPQ